jgi:hypothetical protein
MGVGIEKCMKNGFHGCEVDWDGYSIDIGIAERHDINCT